MFEQSMVATEGRRAGPFACSAVVQTAGVVAALLVPLLWVEPLPVPSLTLPPLLAPRVLKAVPVVASARTGASAETPRLFLRILRPFTAPASIPAMTPGVEDAPSLPPAESVGGSGVPAGFVLFGTPGLAGGVGELSGNPPEVARPEPPPATQTAVLVGGAVQAAKLIAAPRPAYPPLARQVRVEGVVVLSARIDAAGKVAGLKVESGHRLLVEAAVTAVRQWRYAPTLLNGKPVEVLTTIEVRFTLR